MHVDRPVDHPGFHADEDEERPREGQQARDGHERNHEQEHCEQDLARPMPPSVVKPQAETPP